MKEFKGDSKDGLGGVFSRDRKLTFKNVIVMIINFKSSIQRELDGFFKAISKSDFKIREVTKGAFSQARAKLNPWAFKRLNEVAVNSFYEGAEYYTWYGMRTLAVDGTRLVLPNHPSVIEEFGQHNFGPNADSPRSLALASMLYDTLNLVTIDAQIAPYSSSEGDLLALHLDKVKAGDLLLLDRGYPCFWLLFMLKAKGIEFCVRLKDNWWLKVKDFTESDEIERIVTFSLPKKDRKKLAEYPHMQDSTITCRLIKIVLETGEKEILCTSLTDTEKYLYEEFDSLYHYRWNEEEAYKLLKSRIELENFSGKTAKAVKQDFHAKVFLMSLCSAYAHPIEERVVAEYKADQERKYDQKINRTNALSMTQDILIAVFIRKQFGRALQALII
ncbi:MAG: IS4 family transposase [Mariniphaga sp.]|nr:IS4 family transposase [Mariniphaga sp.]